MPSPLATLLDTLPVLSSEASFFVRMSTIWMNPDNSTIDRMNDRILYPLWYQSAINCAVKEKSAFSRSLTASQLGDKLPRISNKRFAPSGGCMLVTLVARKRSKGTMGETGAGSVETRAVLRLFLLTLSPSLSSPLVRGLRRYALITSVMHASYSLINAEAGVHACSPVSGSYISDKFTVWITSSDTSTGGVVVRFSPKNRISD